MQTSAPLSTSISQRKYVSPAILPPNFLSEVHGKELVGECKLFVSEAPRDSKCHAIPYVTFKNVLIVPVFLPESMVASSCYCCRRQG